MAPRAVIWADSGPGVGLGHLARCGALAAELERLGVTVELFTPDKDGERAAREAGRNAAVRATVSVLAAGGPALAIVDSYRVTAADVEALRTAGMYVAAFDDTAGDVLPADVVINGAPGAETAYQHRPEQHYLLGAAYFPLRAEFCAAPVKRVRDRVEHVLVTVGGEDVHGLLTPFMAIAAASFAGARIVGAAGSRPGSAAAAITPHPETTGTGRMIRTEAVAMTVSDRCDVRYAPSDYPDLVRDADVIICGGGQSLIEAAASGTPAAAVVLGDDQRPQRAAVIAAGAALDGGDWRLPPAEQEARLRDALEQIRPAWFRARLSARGRALVDGAGARRIAKGILDRWQA